MKYRALIALAPGGEPFYSNTFSTLGAVESLLSDVKSCLDVDGQVTIEGIEVYDAGHWRAFKSYREYQDSRQSQSV